MGARLRAAWHVQGGRRLWMLLGLSVTLSVGSQTGRRRPVRCTEGTLRECPGQGRRAERLLWAQAHDGLDPERAARGVWGEDGGARSRAHVQGVGARVHVACGICVCICVCNCACMYTYMHKPAPEHCSACACVRVRVASRSCARTCVGVRGGVGSSRR